MRNIRRKGFTLVELLIVIVVIGILSAMMMLSSTEAVSSAKANNIISNLRNLKTALASWYMDNIDRVAITYENNGKISTATNTVQIADNDGSNKQSFMTFVESDAGKKEILKYLSNNGGGITLTSKSASSIANGAYIVKDDKYADWYICYKVSDKDVKDKLTSRAKTVGLVGKTTITNDDIVTPYNGQDFVCMFVLSLGEKKN